jgi:hypothetical protein
MNLDLTAAYSECSTALDETVPGTTKPHVEKA